MKKERGRRALSSESKREILRNKEKSNLRA